MIFSQFLMCFSHKDSNIFQYLILNHSSIFALSKTLNHILVLEHATSARQPQQLLQQQHRVLTNRARFALFGLAIALF